MISIIFGDENYLVLEKLEEIEKKNSNSLITKIDGLDKDFSINEIVEACQNVGLFNDSHLVLVKDPIFLIKKYEDKDIDALLNYCHSPNYETDLVFYTLDNSFNERLKVFKDISSNADVCKMNQLNRNEFYSYARSIVNDYKLDIDKDAINLLINSANFNLSLLTQNLKVLSLYPDRIDSKALTRLISFSSDEDVFNLINALTNKQTSLAIKYANKLMDNDESILRLISTLASQLRFLYNVSYYMNNGKTTNEIMNILNIKSSYRIDKAIDTLRHIDGYEIEELLSKLADLDYECKRNDDINDRLRLELFIVSLVN